MASEPLFSQFFLGGFECSSHRLRSGKRLDLISATHHDIHAADDYRRLREHGIATARDGVRWHLIEQRPGHYDWSSVLPMLRAARATGIQIIWDLCHYGWPDDLDIFGPDFQPRFAAFARAFAQLVARESDAIPFYAPVNEISFFSWAAGDAGYLNPFSNGRGFELKTQLVRSALTAIDAIWSVDARARIVHPDPLINIVAAPERPEERDAAEGHRQAQFQAWDMISGRVWPQLGGHPRYLDIIGINYYPNNQWVHGGRHLNRFDSQYRLLHHLLHEVYERYRRPLFVAETGCENAERPEWLRYVTREVRAALRNGVPVEGVCLYPILNHPGWDDERHCHNGLFDYLDEAGNREVYLPLAQELQAQRTFHTVARVPPKQRKEPAQAGDASLPHVCLYTDSPDPSGMGEMMLTLATQLRATHRVSLVCSPHGAGARLLERAAALGIDKFALPLDGGHAATEPLRDWLHANQVQVFHGHAGIGWEGLHATYVAHCMGVPAVVRTEHLPYLLTDPQQRADHARLMEILDQLVCVSNAARQTFLDAGVPAQRLRVIRNGIAPRPPQRDRAATRALLELAPQDRLVVTVGRMSEQKGYDVLLAAIPAILARQPRARFFWIGDGPLLEELRVQVRAAGLDHAVHLLGRRSDTADLLAAADLFVLPSRFEGLPLAVLEAQAAGLPVVGTEVCGTTEVVEDGVTGRLVAPERPDALADAVAEALSNPARAAAWAAAGRARVGREFSAARMAHDTVALYNELLNIAAGRPAPTRAKARAQGAHLELTPNTGVRQRPTH